MTDALIMDVVLYQGRLAQVTGYVHSPVSYYIKLLDSEERHMGILPQELSQIELEDLE